MASSAAPVFEAGRTAERPTARGMQRRWRPCWRRFSVLAFTIGFWSLAGWGIATLLGSRP